MRGLPRPASNSKTVMVDAADGGRNLGDRMDAVESRKLSILMGTSARSPRLRVDWERPKDLVAAAGTSTRVALDIVRRASPPQTVARRLKLLAETVAYLPTLLSSALLSSDLQFASVAPSFPRPRLKKRWLMKTH